MYHRSTTLTAAYPSQPTQLPSGPSTLFRLAKFTIGKWTVQRVEVSAFPGITYLGT